MRAILAALTASALFSGAALADDGPVVVELFTSQGCSSCPPAHEILDLLAAEPEIIALALHVDYWDYLGWRDSFGSAQNSDRQQAYARAAGQRTVYTPQFIVEGQDHIIGAKAMEVMSSIRAHEGIETGVDLVVERNGDLHVISLTAAQSAPMVVQLVRYLPHQDVEVLGGENAGRQLSYTNIVTRWDIIADWDGAGPLTLDVEISGSDPAVLIVQGAGAGPILAAARFDR